MLQSQIQQSLRRPIHLTIVLCLALLNSSKIENDQSSSCSHLHLGLLHIGNDKNTNFETSGNMFYQYMFPFGYKTSDTIVSQTEIVKVWFQ